MEGLDYWLEAKIVLGFSYMYKTLFFPGFYTLARSSACYGDNSC
jgi:hypothetical protein